MSVYPQRIHQTSNTELRIEWSDGHVGRYTMVGVRSNCPCATCREQIETSGGSAANPGVQTAKYDMIGIEVVGSYALQISWADGHHAGIYPYELLRRICECEACRGKGKQ